MKRYSSWEIARIRVARQASDAREQARQAESRDQAITVGLVVLCAVLTLAWVGCMAWAARQLGIV